MTINDFGCLKINRKDTQPTQNKLSIMPITAQKF